MSVGRIWFKKEEVNILFKTVCLLSVLSPLLSVQDKTTEECLGFFFFFKKG